MSHDVAGKQSRETAPCMPWDVSLLNWAERHSPPHTVNSSSEIGQAAPKKRIRDLNSRMDVRPSAGTWLVTPFVTVRGTSDGRDEWSGQSRTGAGRIAASEARDSWASLDSAIRSRFAS